MNVVLASAVGNGAFGLLGAGIGGLSSWLVQRTAFEHERHTQTEQRKAEAQAAWKVLELELANALDTVYDTRSKGAWPIGCNRNWQAAWQDSRAAVTRDPDGKDPGPVAAACARLDELQSAVNAGRSEEERKLKARDQVFLDEMQELLEELELAPHRTPAARVSPAELEELKRVAREEEESAAPG
jgi:hypothetical protein